MKITPPTNPYHLARAYSVGAPGSVGAQRPVQPVAPVSRGGADASVARKLPTNIDRLVAGVVPGSIDFSEALPKPAASSGAIPMYRHPADLNAAATSVDAGRTIDVSA